MKKRPQRVARPISNDCEIRAYMHCALCLQEVQSNGDMAPRDYARLSVGLTAVGIQVWCERHQSNVLHIDFEGTQHPADTTRKAPGTTAVALIGPRHKGSKPPTPAKE